MNLQNLAKNDTIIACATAPGRGAIAVIRISGPEAIVKCYSVFKAFSKSGSLLKSKGYSVHFGQILDGERVVDEVLVNVFKNPKSFTGEDTVEISCHGSSYITNEIVNLFVCHGVRPADAGEFTLRAYRNGKMDLSQAEAVADLIHSTTKASSSLALKQLKGNVRSEIQKLREQLINFASLIELELDFSEEDVEFADRKAFKKLIEEILVLIQKLLESFSLGNAIKNGIPVAIVGEPNVGKSTLLNALLNEDRAIVSDIAGTTRDTIEDELNIKGVSFRFIDTAGIRETTDIIEQKGIAKTFDKIEQAQVVLCLLDATKDSEKEALIFADDLKNRFPNSPKKILFLLNKVDLLHSKPSLLNYNFEHLFISAKDGIQVENIKEKLSELVNLEQIESNDVIITNSRHYDAFQQVQINLKQVLLDMDQQIPGDLLAINIRQALHHLGTITGEISSDDLLGNIFSKFCIGK